MRRLIMWNLVTLDGYFEGPTKWDIGWHEYAWGDEMEQLSLEQLAAADMLLFGRVTYEGMAGYWPTATGAVADLMNGIPKTVFSSTIDHATWANTKLVKGSTEKEVARLKQQPGRDVFIFGSAELSSTLSRHGLIDEYRLGVVPVILGSGNPLFKPGADRLKLQLIEAKPLKTGCVILRYQPEAIR
jgi:dihydrofolate reductase